MYKSNKNNNYTDKKHKKTSDSGIASSAGGLDYYAVR